jgi:hypothetical protein
MSWLSSLFSGDKNVSRAAAQLTTGGQQAMGMGMGDISSAQNFFNKILSGGATQALAPQISSIERQQQQDVQGLSQFGNRAGGVNAAMQAAGDQTRGEINNIIASLTGTAASTLGTLGTTLTGQGMTGLQAGANLNLQNKSLFQNLMESAGAGIGKMIGNIKLPGLSG